MVNEKQNNNKNYLFYLLIIAIIASLSFLIWNVYKQNNKINEITQENSELQEEKNELENELEQMIEKYENLESDNDSLLLIYQAEVEKIKKFKKKLQNSNWNIYTLKKETDVMRSALKGYISQIDSLNTVAIKLTNKNKKISRKLKDSKKENSTLQVKNNNLRLKLKDAAVLQVKSITIKAIKIRNSNIGKKTSRAKKTSKIRVDLLTVPNKIANKSSKTIYIRIIQPNGEILRSAKNKNMQAMFNNARGFYSGKTTFNNTGEEQAVRIDWEKSDQEKLKKGEYTIEIYESGTDIAREKLILK